MSDQNLALNFDVDVASIQIESDIPLPNGQYVGDCKWQPVVRSMKLKDSFFLPIPADSTETQAIRYAFQKMERKVTIRTRNENGVVGCRIWRIK